MGAVIGGVVGVAASAVVTQHYTASTSVLVTATGVNDTTTLANSRTTGTINLDTESKIVTSSVVAAQVQATDPKTRHTSIAALLKPVTVTVPANTSILTIGYESTSASAAARLANDFGKAYLAQRLANAQATVHLRAAKVTAELTKLTQEFQQVSKQKNALPKSATTESALLNNRRTLLQSQIRTLTAQATRLTTTVITPGQVLSSATAPSNPTSPSQVLYGGAGFAIGLLLGLAIAWLRFTVRIRARRPDDLVLKLQLPVLAEVQHDRSRGLVLGKSIALEEYRRTFNVLATAMPSPGLVVVAGRGSTAAVDAVAANLARAGATSGAISGATSRALLFDDTVFRLQSTEAGSGSDLLVRRPPDTELTHAGLEELRGNGYLFVAGAEKGIGSAAVQALSAGSGAVILVVEAKSRIREASTLLDELDTVGAPILGVVIVARSRVWTSASKAQPARPENSVRDDKASASTDSAPKTDGKATETAEAADASGDSGDDHAKDTADANTGATANNNSDTKPDSKPDTNHSDTTQDSAANTRPGATASKNNSAPRPNIRARQRNRRGT